VTVTTSHQQDGIAIYRHVPQVKGAKSDYITIARFSAVEDVALVREGSRSDRHNRVLLEQLGRRRFRLANDQRLRRQYRPKQLGSRMTFDQGGAGKTAGHNGQRETWSGDLQRKGCPKFRAGNILGRVARRDLTEASGLAVSRKNPGVLFSHNDSGDTPRLFAMTAGGRDLGTYHLGRAKSIDWEDLATGPAERPGEWYIYVGDIGANTKPRREISVYRVLEPTVALDQESKKRKLEEVERFDFTYPTRDAPDAETLMVDPRTGDLFLVTKPHQSTPMMYRAKSPLSTKRSHVLEEVAALRVFERGARRSRLVTSGDISPDGSMVLIRSYTTAYLWMRSNGESVVECIQREPCSVPLSLDRHGEAIAFSPDGQSYYTVSEGLEPEILRFDRLSQP